MNTKQKRAIDSALHTHCEDTYIVMANGRSVPVQTFDGAARRGHVPEAFALAHLHRVFIDTPLDEDYLETVKILKSRMC